MEREYLRLARFRKGLIPVTFAIMLSACGSGDANASQASSQGETRSVAGSAGRGIFEDNGLAQEDMMGYPEVKRARAALSAELMKASQGRGQLSCGLPMMPGATARESLPGQPGFITGKTAGEVAAFYWAAADAAGGFAMVGATPAPFARIHLPDGRNCHVSATATSDGADFVVTDQGYMGLIEEEG